MEVTATLSPRDRAEWRAWLAANHRTAAEIWVLSGGPTYLETVLEALCFGWIDGIAKKHGEFTAQRFTPRRPRSNWTELNKERCRKLIASGRMTEAGLAVLPDLEAPYVLDPAVAAALRADPAVWANFEAFPALYQRIRAGYVVEARKDRAEFERRLAKLVEQTRAGRMFGRWEDPHG